MNYSTEIEAYSAGQMSEVERMAFEHELEDNATLQAEWEADQLMQDLLGQAASQLSVEDILATGNPVVPTTQPKVVTESTTSVNSKYRSLVLVALLCCTCFYYILEYGDFQEKIKEDAIPNKAVVLPNSVPVVAKKVQLLEKSTKQEQEEVFQEYKEKETPIIKKPVAAPLDKKKERIRPIALNEQQSPIYSETLAKNTKVVTDENQKSTTTFSKPSTSRASNVESSKQLRSGTAVKMIADNSITLKPGFHAPAGTSFTAAIGEE